MNVPDEPAHATRTTVLVALALAVLLLVAYAVASGRKPAATTAPSPSQAPVSGAPAPATPAPSPPSVAVPTPAPDDPSRALGPLEGRSLVVSGRGTVVLRYARAPHDGTRVHLICTGCDARTWLVDLRGGRPVVGDGPLPDPSDATGVTDLRDPAGRSALLVRAPADASWTVTLTPFAELPVHEQSFEGLGADVVAVRAVGDVNLTCGAPYDVRTLAREEGSREPAIVQRVHGDDAGTATLHPGRGTDRLVLDVRCPGRWSVAVP